MYHTETSPSAQQSRQKDRSGATLGSTAKKSSTSPFVKRKIRKKMMRYWLLNHAQDLLIEADVKNRNKTYSHRTCGCQRKPAFGTESIAVKTDGETASYSGLQNCASVWSCPVCAAKIAAERSREIAKAIEWAELNDYVAVMVAFTAAHRSTTSLRWFADKFAQAWGAFASGGGWVKLRRKYNFKRWIKALEVTDGSNGWHLHKHVLFFVHKSDMPEGDAAKQINIDLSTRWLSELRKVGLYASKAHGTHTKTGKQASNDYLVKLNSAVENLKHELTNKSSKDSKTHWDLLETSMNTKETEAGKRFVEFVQVMSGKNWIRWSNGFKQEVGIEDVTDSEIAEKDDTAHMETVTEINLNYWEIVRWFHLQAAILELAVNRDALGIWELIYKTQCEAVENGKLLHLSLDTGSKVPHAPPELRRLRRLANPELQKQVIPAGDEILAPPAVQQKMFDLSQEFRYE